MSDSASDDDEGMEIHFETRYVDNIAGDVFVMHTPLPIGSPAARTRMRRLLMYLQAAFHDSDEFSRVSRFAADVLERDEQCDSVTIQFDNKDACIRFYAPDLTGSVTTIGALASTMATFDAELVSSNTPMETEFTDRN